MSSSQLDRWLAVAAIMVLPEARYRVHIMLDPSKSG